MSGLSQLPIGRTDFTDSEQWYKRKRGCRSGWGNWIKVAIEFIDVTDVSHISLKTSWHTNPPIPSMRWWPKDIVAEPPAAYSLLRTQGRWRNSKTLRHRVHLNPFHAMTKDLSWFFGRLVESTFSVFDIVFLDCKLVHSALAHGIFLFPLTKMQSMTERLFPIRVAEETEGVAGQTVEERWWKQRRNQYRHKAYCTFLRLGLAWNPSEEIKLSHGQVLPSCPIHFNQFWEKSHLKKAPYRLLPTTAHFSPQEALCKDLV